MKQILINIFVAAGLIFLILPPVVFIVNYFQFSTSVAIATYFTTGIIYRDIMRYITGI